METKAARSLASGLVGAVALNVVHEAVRHRVRNAPQVQILGMRAVANTLRALGRRPPKRRALYWSALAADVASNTAYYGLVGLGDPKRAPARGAVLGVAAGIGAVLLPGPLGLGSRPVARTPATRAMTIAWYGIGGVAAGVAMRAISRDKS